MIKGLRTAIYVVSDMEKRKSWYSTVLGLGAAIHAPVKDVGGGIKLASVVDPFGNVFGIIENPDFNPASVE